MDASLIIGSLWFLFKILLFFHPGDQICLVAIDSATELHGIRKYTANQTPYCAYMGIPYANVNRFQIPRMKIANWHGRKNVQRKGSICMQTTQIWNIIGKENCLFLNIYTKAASVHARDEQKLLLPVLVFIHGGSFFVGSAGSDLKIIDHVIESEIVVVTFNYRLGLFGFLNLPNFPLNLGLRDQQTALQWIQRYISYFNGNPKDVSLAGWSAGAASVTYHLYARGSNNLFHKAIAMSGTFLNPFAFNENSRNCSYTLLKDFCRNCSVKSFDRKILEEPTAETLVHRTKNLNVNFFGEPYPCFVPTADDDFIIRPADISRLNPFNRVPLLIGHTTFEDICNGPHRWNENHENATILFENINIPLEKTEIRRWMQEFVQKLLLKRTADDVGNSEEFHDLHRIADMIHGIVSFAYTYSESVNKSVYYYEYALENSAARKRRRKCDLSIVSFGREGAFHGDDISLLFDAKTSLDENENKTKREMLLFITNFIKHGDPTPFNEINVVSSIPHWPPFTPQKSFLMHIARSLSVKRRYEQTKMYKSWESFYKCLYYNEKCMRFSLEPKN